ncbi:MAG: glutaredoxin 3 [Sphingomonadales bacterium]
MADIIIYTQMLCPYCTRAKKILQDKGADFEERDVTMQPALRAQMREESGGRNSVPQIFIGETHVGGCDDLMALDAANELDPLLASVR